jgi:predicted nucleic-acid-binding Zn-ribbon protein
MEDYSVKINKYFKYIKNNMFILDVEKLCGYSEFVFVYKNSTMNDVRNSIFQHFECSHNETKRLFVTKTPANCVHSHGNQSTVPMDIHEDCIVLSESPELFREFVNNNSEYFRPLYDLPCKVVYKIYLDDGHIQSNNV